VSSSYRGYDLNYWVSNIYSNPKFLLIFFKRLTKLIIHPYVVCSVAHSVDLAGLHQNTTMYSNVMHINVMFLKSMNVVFMRLGFVIQKGLTAQLISCLSSIQV